MVNRAFEANELIRIDLSNGREIEAAFVSQNPTSLTVKNGKDLLHGKHFKNTQTFYLPEIKKYYSLNDRERNDSSNVNTHMPGPSKVVDSSHSGSNSNSNTKMDTKSVEFVKKPFGDDEVERIQNAMKNAIYISLFDEKYHEAIKNMKRQKIIAVNSENSFGRLEPKRPLIAIASGDQVYLFDMLRLGAMKKEFKEIFAADSPRKIIHRSAQFSDYLAHTENCTLNNAFDTLVRIKILVFMSFGF